MRFSKAKQVVHLLDDQHHNTFTRNFRLTVIADINNRYECWFKFVQWILISQKWFCWQWNSTIFWFRAHCFQLSKSFSSSLVTKNSDDWWELQRAIVISLKSWIQNHECRMHWRYIFAWIIRFYLGSCDLWLMSRSLKFILPSMCDLNETFYILWRKFIW